MSVEFLGDGEWGITSDDGTIVAVLSDDVIVSEWDDFEKATSKERFFYWLLTRECIKKSPIVFKGVCLASFQADK